MNHITRILIFIFLFLNFQNPASALSDSLISREALMHTVEILTSAEMEGRLPGHAGFTRAASYMTEQFQNLGLIPAGDDGYYQHMKVEYNAIPEPCGFELHLRSQIFMPRHGVDYTFRGFTGSGDLFAPVVFAGFGISMPEYGYDDFAGLDLKGKIVMVFKNNPDWKLPDTSWPGALPREKANVAREHGAGAIIFVSAPFERIGIPEIIGSVLHGPGEQPADFPQLMISRELADKILAESGNDLETLYNELKGKQQPISFETGSKAHISVRTEYNPEASAFNIIGMIEGNDAERKNEFIVIGAHLDHVGSQCGTIYPGANDNASGSAAVLEIARAFSLSEIKPSRSLIFVLFTSEEQGLLGAGHFVENFPEPHKNIIAMLNFDCIAHGDSIQIGNGKSSPELWELARKSDNEKLVVDRTWGGGGADLTPFFNAGIPGLYMVSTNSYTYLHTPEDKPETLNPGLFEAIVRLGFRIIKELAE